ncbi:MAG: GAF domain-containing protein, partial [Chloroflexi bacterium]|nr:GAF domain-containing protein [Chloroflexota bacterium]
MQRLLDSRTFFTMPLLAKGKTVGGIIASTREELSEQDAEKLMTFANQAAVAIENARLYQETQQRALEQETLREAALALTTALDRNRVIERILAQLQQVAPYDTASVQLLRENRMEIVGGRGFPNLPDLLGTSFPADGDNPNSEVIRTRAPFIVEDAPAVYEAFRKDPHRQAAGRSWLGVPMLVGEQLVGMIALDKREPGFYTQGHARLAEAFAAQAAVAIENARLFEEEKRRSAQLALINEVGGQAASILDPDRLMQEVTRSIRESFNYYNVALLLLDEEHREVVLRAIAGGFEHVTPGDYRQSIDEGIIGFVARTGNPWLANDTSKDPYYVKGFSEVILTKSELCIPIKLGDEIIGVLDVQSIRLNAFDQADVVAMEAVADRLAMGIQNARLYEEMAGLYDVGLAVTSALELDKTLRAIYEQVNHLMSLDTFYIALYDEARGELRFDIFVEEGEWLPKFTKKLDEGGLTAWIVQARKPLFIGDIEEERESQPVAPSQKGKPGTRSWMGFPLIARDKVVGVISVQSFRPQAFTEGNKRILAAFANQAAVAVENARLYEQVTQHVKALSTLHEISQELTSTLELDQILHAIAENTIKLTGAARSLFLLVDPEARQMVLATGHGYSREHLTEFTFEEFEAGLSGWVRRERKPALVADVQTDARQAGIALQHSKQHGSRSLAIAPLWIKGEVVGTLTAIGTPEAPVFTDETLELVVMLANQAAIAIENAQLYEETRRRSQEVATLNAIVQALNASLDVQDVFQVVATELRRLVEFDRASIALTDQALQNFTVYALVDQPDAPLGAGVTMPLAATAAGQDALAGRLHLTEDLSTELDFPGERLLYDAGLRSRVIAPLMVGERLIGSLNLASTRTAAFSEQVLGLLQQVAGAIAAALENARLFEETEHLKTFNENVVQGIAEAILIEDAQGVFTFANPAAGELLGYTREELIGRHWATIVSEEQVEKVQQELTKRPHEIVSRYEMALLSKEGQVIPVIVSGRPLLEDGKFVGVLSAFTDIRERVRAEREIEERRVYLERVLGAAPDA